MAKKQDYNLWFPIRLSDGRMIKSQDDLRPEERKYEAVKKQGITNKKKKA